MEIQEIIDELTKWEEQEGKSRTVILITNEKVEETDEKVTIDLHQAIWGQPNDCVRSLVLAMEESQCLKDSFIKAFIDVISNEE